MAHIRRLVAAQHRGIVKNGISSFSMLSTASITTFTSIDGSRKESTIEPLHRTSCRSAFSFLEGASTARGIHRRLRRILNMPAMALLDRDGVYGAPRFHLAAAKAGIQATSAPKCFTSIEPGVRYPLLAETREGYQNLCRLITRMKLRAPKGKGAITEEELGPYARGLICLTGGEHGPLTNAIPNKNGSPDRWSVLSTFSAATMSTSNCNATSIATKKRSTSRRLHLQQRFGFLLLATNGVRYAAQAGTRDSRCLHVHPQSSDAGNRRPAAGEKFRTSSQNTRGNDAGSFTICRRRSQNTIELSSRLQFTLKDLGYEFPNYPVTDGDTMASFLRKRTDEGARERFQPYDEKSRRQIERELTLIEKLGSKVIS